ncbi:hypothetical protein [Streptomyces sp. NPDC058683]|uniref:hypothetical protein n=1 Tax=Streptomyces sp. NPDC058683 TaxID=3346597 RepID=UPI003658BD51
MEIHSKAGGCGVAQGTTRAQQEARGPRIDAFLPDLQALWDGFPDEAGRQLTAALSDVCHEPYSETEPWGIDDGINRILVRSLITVRSP